MILFGVNNDNLFDTISPPAIFDIDISTVGFSSCMINNFTVYEVTLKILHPNSDPGRYPCPNWSE